MFSFWVAALPLLASQAWSQSQGHSELNLDHLELSGEPREGRILGPRLISHVQAPNNLVYKPASQSQADGNTHPQTVGSDQTLHAIPISFDNTHYQTLGQDPVNVYPVQLPASHPVVASLNKNENVGSTGVITGYPVIVHIPDQHQPIAVYRGQFPQFIERILQRIQNRYSVYNPPEYFENKPRPELELQPPAPPLCVESAETDGRNESTVQEGYAYVPPCTPTTTTTTTESPTTYAAGYSYEEPKPVETVFNGTIILINCTDLHLEPETTTSSTSTPYIYATPTTTSTTPPPVPGPYFYEPPAAPHEGELFVIPAKPLPSPPPTFLYIPPSPSPPPANTYIPPTTTTTTTTPAPIYLPPETPKPSTSAPIYLPPETPKPSTPSPTYLPPTTTKPPSLAPSYIPPEPAPIYLPPQAPAHSYKPPAHSSTPAAASPVSYVVSSAGKGTASQPVNHVNININGFQQANSLPSLLPFPLRFLHFKKLLLAKLLNLNN